MGLVPVCTRGFSVWRIHENLRMHAYVCCMHTGFVSGSLYYESHFLDYDQLITYFYIFNFFNKMERSKPGHIVIRNEES